MESTGAVKAAVVDGAGAVVVSALAVENESAQARLIVIPITGVDLTRTMHAIWIDRQLPPAADALLKYLVP